MIQEIVIWIKITLRTAKYRRGYNQKNNYRSTDNKDVDSKTRQERQLSNPIPTVPGSFTKYVFNFEELYPLDEFSLVEVILISFRKEVLEVTDVLLKLVGFFLEELIRELQKQTFKDI
ncbi:hypothetical protein QE152_g4196 [Popillia japonica]|uniref:Uncharacterized protein n=1 Tax=Popillia japonica TaxID=7064 RepID=A0AAW1MWU2_POPJA